MSELKDSITSDQDQDKEEEQKENVERISLDEVGPRAEHYMAEERFHCSQAVALAINDHLGVDSPLPIRMLGGFAGGIGLQGMTCGALTGAVACLGHNYGRGRTDETEDPALLPAAQKITTRFKDEVSDGETNCREIIGFDWTDGEKVMEFLNEGGRDRCVELTGKAARITAEVIGEKED